MKSNAITKGNLKTLAIVFGILVFLFFIYKIRPLLLFIFIATIITLIGRPLVLFFKTRFKFNNTLAAIFTLLIFTTFFAMAIKIFVPIILNQSKEISEIDFKGVKKDLNELNIQASEYIGVDQINIIEAIKRTEFIQNFNTDIIVSFFYIFLNNITNFIVGIFSVLFISYFFLRDEKIILYSVIALAPSGKEAKLIKILEKVRELLTRYFLGLLLQTAIIIFFYVIILFYIDIKNPLAVGILCGLLNIVPYLGPILGLVIMILVLVSNNLGADFSSVLLPELIVLVVGVSIVQLLDNIISQPVIFSKSVRSHPLEIFLIIIIGALLFDVFGMILAIPVYTTIKVIAKEFLSEYKIVKRLTKNI